MPPSIAIIKVHNLRLRTYIGFNPEETSKQQDIIINLEIHYAMNQAVLDDKVSAALNYKTITKNIIQHVENGHFLLLEKLVSDVLNLCTPYPEVQYVQVSIEKPHALRFADSVSLTLDYTATPSSLQTKASS